MNKFTRIVLPAIFGLCAFVGGVCKAQNLSETFSVQHYTDENGLPQNSIPSIGTDGDGFIWLPTAHGMVRFDGQQFYVFNKTNTSSRSVTFYDLQPDVLGRKGMLYARGQRSNVMRLEHGLATSEVDGPHNLYHWQIAEFADTVDIPIVASGAPSDLFSEFAAPFKEYIILIPSSPGSYYLIANDRTEFVRNWKTEWKLNTIETNFKDYFGLKGNLYKLSPDGGVERFGPSGISKMSIEGDLKRDSDYKAGRYNYKMYWNHVSDQLFLLLGDRFYQLEPSSPTTWTSRLVLQGFEFEKNNISAVHYDVSNRRFFLGSVTRGLFVLTKKNLRTLKVSDQDPDNNLYAHAPYQGDKVVTTLGIVLGLSKSGERTRSVLPALNSLTDLDVRSMLVDRKGNIWVKSQHTLSKFNSEGTKVLKTWRTSEEIKTIYEAPDGRIWAALYKSGLLYVNKDETLQKPGLVSSQAILHPIYMLQRGDIMWVGALTGLYAVNVKTAKTRLIPGTEKLSVRSMYITPSLPDGMFLLTYEDGIFFYENEKLIHFPMDDEAKLAAAHCIVEDRKGFFWIPTNKGLFQFAKSDLLAYARLSEQQRKMHERLFYLYYDREDGLATNEFNGGCQPCAVKLKNGTVSLPSLNGLVWFNPDKIHPEIPDKTFIVDRVVIQGRTKLLTGDSLTLGTDPKQISFHVALPYFGNVNGRQISYALVRSGKKPEDSDWIQMPSADPTIRFSELASGDYLLLIRKVNGFGLNNYLTKQILITVTPHWYERIWARLFFAMIAFLLIYLYMRYRTRLLQRTNQELEKKVAVRTKHLEEANGFLQETEKTLNRQMHILNSLVGSIGHDIRTPLKYLKQSADEIETRIADAEYKHVINIGQSISGSATKMGQLLDNLMSYIRLQVYGNEIQLKQTLIYPIIQEKAELFRLALQAQSNVLEIQLNENEMVESHPQLLAVVLHNLIDNAIKYTFEGRIRITSERTGDRFQLVISDSGQGMPAGVMDWMNSAVTYDSVDKVRGASDEFRGLGLIIVKEILVMIKASLVVTRDHGTQVRVIFENKR